MDVESQTHTDEDLVRRFAAGDRDALESLAARFEQPLLGMAKGLLRGRDDLARDAVQEAWMRVIRYAPSFNGRSSAKTWLYRIVINRCRTMQSTLNRIPIATETAQRESSNDRQTTSTAARGSSGLQAAVDRLPVDRRAIVLLCYHRGLTHEQAAEVLEVPLGTLKSRLHATLNELRETLARENANE